MRGEIRRFSDSHLAGYEWTWKFILERQMDGTFSLSAEQHMADPEDDADVLPIEPVHQLRRGADVYERLDEMLNVVCENLEQFDVEDIATAWKPTAISRRWGCDDRSAAVFCHTTGMRQDRIPERFPPDARRS
jgi:hypothetical protein